MPKRRATVRWYIIFRLLSLERVELFVSEIGLKPTIVSLIRPVAKRFVEQFEEITGSDEVIQRQQEALLNDTFDKIARITDVGTSNELHKWGTQQFPWGGVEGNKEFTWAFLLRQLAGLNGSNSEVVPLPLPENKLEVIIRAIKGHLGDFNVLDKQIQEAEKRPRTEWEERVYQAYGEDGSPLDALVNAIEYQRFRRTWGYVKSILSGEELKILLQWGKSQAKHIDILAANLDSIELPD